jgi:hypothetical protein
MLEQFTGPFNPHSEITPSDWVEMRAQFTSLRHKDSIREPLTLASSIAIMSPDLSPRIPAEAHERLMKEIKEPYRSQTIEQIVTYARPYRALFPERVNELRDMPRPHVYRSTWDMLIRKFGEGAYYQKQWQFVDTVVGGSGVWYGEKIAWRYCLDQAEAIRMLFPEREFDLRANYSVSGEHYLKDEPSTQERIARANSEFPEAYWGYLQTNLARFRDRDKTPCPSASGEVIIVPPDWGQYAEVAASVRLVFPGRKSELGVDDKARQGMRAKLQELREEVAKPKGSYLWPYFAKLAADMSIIDAEDVQITDKGIVLQFPGA